MAAVPAADSSDHSRFELVDAAADLSPNQPNPLPASSAPALPCGCGCRQRGVGFCAVCGVLRCRKGFGLGSGDILLASWNRFRFRSRDSDAGLSSLQCLGCQHRQETEQPQPHGVARERTADFARYRSWFRRASADNPTPLPMAAVARLASAYWFWSAAQRSTASTAAVKALAALVVEPEWTRVNIGRSPSAAATAQSRCCASPGCGRVFSPVVRRYACRLCGSEAFCDRCVYRSIRIWSRPGSTPGPDSVVVDLARPGDEPPGAYVLRGCGPCIDQLGQTALSPADKHPVIEAFLSVHSGLVEFRAAVVAALPSFKSQVDALSGAGSRGNPNDITTGGKAMIRTMAKHQADLTSVFGQYQSELSQLRRGCGATLRPGLPPVPQSHQRVAESAARAHALFLQGRLWEFNRLRSELKRSVSADVLEAICTECDVLAVTNVLCILSQLGLELVAFPGAEPAAEHIVASVAAVEIELAVLVERRQQPWPEHRSAVQLQVAAMARETPQLLQFFNRRNWHTLVRIRVQKNFEAMMVQLRERGTRAATTKVLAMLERGCVDTDTALERLADAPPVVDGDWQLV